MQYLKPESQKVIGGRPPLTANFAPPPTEEYRADREDIANLRNVSTADRREVYEIRSAKI